LSKDLNKKKTAKKLQFGNMHNIMKDSSCGMTLNIPSPVKADLPYLLQTKCASANARNTTAIAAANKERSTEIATKN
jgi:hypothetical protein